MGLLDKIKKHGKVYQESSPELLAQIDNYRFNFGEPMELTVTAVTHMKRPANVQGGTIDVDYYTLNRQVCTEYKRPDGGIWSITTDLNLKELPCNAHQNIKVGEKVLLLMIPIGKDDDG